MGQVKRAAVHAAVAVPRADEAPVTTLMEEALAKLATARTHMQSGEALQKNHHIQWAMSIIGTLQETLVHGRGGEAAGRLDALYDYMHGQLCRADRHDDAGLLDEVARLMVTIRRDQAWLALHRPVFEPCAV